MRCSTGQSVKFPGTHDYEKIVFLMNHRNAPPRVSYKRTVRQIKNSSRIPAIFVVEPPKASAGVFHVSPLVGFLLGNQTETVRIAFAPRETKGYRFKLPIKVS